MNKTVLYIWLEERKKDVYVCRNMAASIRKLYKIKNKKNPHTSSYHLYTRKHIRACSSGRLNIYLSISCLSVSGINSPELADSF